MIGRGFNDRLRSRIIRDANRLRKEIDEHLANGRLVESELDEIKRIHAQLGDSIARADIAVARAKETAEGVSDAFDASANSMTVAANQHLDMVRAEGIIYMLENAQDYSARAALKLVSEKTIQRWRELLDEDHTIFDLDR